MPRIPRTKNGFAPKICDACAKPFEWRKKWARDWPNVRYFGTPVENITNRELGVAGVMAWYAGESTSLESAVPTGDAPTGEVTADASAGESSSNNQVVFILAAIAAIFVFGLVREVKTRKARKARY
jgi:hypothetical protein